MSHLRHRRSPRPRRQRQLPRLARRRADDLDAGRLRHLAVLLAQARVPAHRRGARPAPEGDRGVDRHRRAHAHARPTQLLAEYRERLTEARAARPTRSSPARARPASSTRPSRSPRRKRKREELIEQTRRDIEAETRRAIQEIRAEVADLTVLATEKVTRKTLDRRRPAPARRGGARRARLRRPRRASGAALAMEEIATVYARSLFEVAQEQDKLDEVREQLGAVRRRARTTTASCRSSSSRPTSPPQEKKDGLERAVAGADAVVLNFLELLIEKHRMPAIFRIRARATTRCGRRRTSSCPVQVTSRGRARRGDGASRSATAIGEQTGRKVELSSQRRPRHPRRHRRPGRQLGARRLHPQPPRTTSQAGRAG